MNLFAKQKQAHSHREQAYGSTEGCEWEIVTDIYSLLCIKQTVNEDLPINTGNSTQYTVVTCMGWKSKKQWIYICM